MDGLLVDTEDRHRESYVEVLNMFNIHLTKEVYYDLWIKQGKGIADYIRENNLNLKPDDIRSKKREIYQSRIKNELIVYAGVKEKLEELFGIYPLGLFSSSYRSDVELILEISHLKKYFELVVTGTDVKKQKPDPEGLLIMNYIWNDVWGESWQCSPQDIVVVGDAEKDIVAANAANMKSIAISNKYTANDDLSNADAVLHCISDVSQDLINQL